MGKEKGGRLIPCDAKNYGKVIWGGAFAFLVYFAV